MMVKLEKIVSCSSEHPTYPAANLLQQSSENWKATWRCAKPGEMLAHVIFQLTEPAYITGVDIGNYQSCVVIVSGSKLSEPDNWTVILNHKFMTNDEAANNKFRDQVQLFTKRELNPDTLTIKFDRIKVTCMQSANLKVLFGLSYVILRSDPTIDLGLDVFGRFKLKQPHVLKTPLEMMKEKLSDKTENEKTDYKTELREQIRRNSMENFAKCQEERKRPMKRPLLEKLEAGEADQVFGKTNQNAKDKNESKDKIVKTNLGNTDNTLNEKMVTRTPFGDIVSSASSADNSKCNVTTTSQDSSSLKKRHLSQLEDSSNATSNERSKHECYECCTNNSQDQPCKICQRLPLATVECSDSKKNNSPKKSRKSFKQLFSDVTFSLSGYVNPQRDEIRRKALDMGARYVPDPNTTNKRCTHLICAFKNTPKYQQFKNYAKIVSHTFIEECYNKRVRLSWRRYALDRKDKSQPESEEEIDGNQPESVYDMDTDAESDC
ncbi:hypothetical protein DMN91_011607 [Ooceraea biroi]|uniref:DNA repair protein XRCC1 n=1 Tax=Ooceraea biroi TaxID=2015173 RepID=A0A026VVY1_OOCBI|nr:DNA repair protein XRCC1 [Ooceraea biroi]XP_011349068.1 DNA repair protein XRCC1 [Ooceraea biroi]EZA47825.1 DNA repair protein XRCC1 [Ooceraea biroi]RLU15851.1 hypothetical protein DMN91_011607 [Ooceraea biroi]